MSDLAHLPQVSLQSRRRPFSPRTEQARSTVGLSPPNNTSNQWWWELMCSQSFASLDGITLSVCSAGHFSISQWIALRSPLVRASLVTSYIRCLIFPVPLAHVPFLHAPPCNTFALKLLFQDLLLWESKLSLHPNQGSQSDFLTWDFVTKSNEMVWKCILTFFLNFSPFQRVSSILQFYYSFLYLYNKCLWVLESIKLSFVTLNQNILFYHSFLLTEISYLKTR